MIMKDGRITKQYDHEELKRLGDALRQEGIRPFREPELKGKERLRDCYVVFQDVNHQLFTESVLDELMIGMENDLSEAKKREEALRILDRFGLKEMADCHPMALSGGQKQRVAIASGVAAGREFLLMDEPTSGMDERNVMRLSEELRRLKSLGKTIYVVTHDHEFINECCDSVIRLRN